MASISTEPDSIANTGADVPEQQDTRLESRHETPKKREKGSIPPSRVANHMRTIASVFCEERGEVAIKAKNRKIRFRDDTSKWLTALVEEVFNDIIECAISGITPVTSKKGKTVNKHLQFKVEHLLRADYTSSKYYPLICNIVNENNINGDIEVHPFKKRKGRGQQTVDEYDTHGCSFATYIQYMINRVKLDKKEKAATVTNDQSCTPGETSDVYGVYSTLSTLSTPSAVGPTASREETPLKVDSKVKEKCSDLIIYFIYSFVETSLEQVMILNADYTISQRHMLSVLATVYGMCGRTSLGIRVANGLKHILDSNLGIVHRDASANENDEESDEKNDEGTSLLVNDSEADKVPTDGGMGEPNPSDDDI